LVWQNCYYTIEFVPAESPLGCMAQCSVFHSQCLSGVFESANRTCRLFNEPLVEPEEEKLGEMVYFMKISLSTGKQI